MHVAGFARNLAETRSRAREARGRGVREDTGREGSFD